MKLMRVALGCCAAGALIVACSKDSNVVVLEPEPSTSSQSTSESKGMIARERQELDSGAALTTEGLSEEARERKMSRMASPPATIITDRITPISSATTSSQDQAFNIYRYTEAFSLQDYVTLDDGSVPNNVQWQFAEVQSLGIQDRYEPVEEAKFVSVLADAISTFSTDVDTASYALLRDSLNRGQLPPPRSVRLEEMINYARYNYKQPTGEHPLAIDTEVTTCPWNPAHRLARVALQGKEVSLENRPAANLVFLIDSSGSMSSDEKIGLLKKSLTKLVETLDDDDRIAIVTYAGSSRLVLDSTPASQKDTILEALNRIQSGGSTNGSGGIEQAYNVALENMDADGINRVILCTDGDFNVGVSSDGALVDLITEKAKTNIFLSVLGFGRGNLNDSMLEKITNAGNGNYSFIDSEKEGYRVLVENASGTLMTIAKDVKIQVEFNPQLVQAYKLIGYENRALLDQDFNNDKKDAGEIGSGHQVTALYEIIPAGITVDENLPFKDPSPNEEEVDSYFADGHDPSNLLYVKVRYKRPDGESSKLITQTVNDIGKSLSQISDDTLLSTSIATFGMMVRREKTTEHMDVETLKDLLAATKSESGNELGELISKYEEIENKDKPS